MSNGTYRLYISKEYVFYPKCFTESDMILKKGVNSSRKMESVKLLRSRWLKYVGKCPEKSTDEGIEHKSYLCKISQCRSRSLLFSKRWGFSIVIPKELIEIYSQSKSKTFVSRYFIQNFCICLYVQSQQVHHQLSPSPAKLCNSTCVKAHV